MWRKPTTAKFIELYKKQKLLWDKNHPQYGEKESREMAFLEIRDGLIDRMPDLTIFELKQKLHGLRTQHIKERNDLKNNLRETPLLWCYDLLHFLRGEPEKNNDDLKMMLQEDLQETSIERPKWTKSNVLNLIKSYKKYPALWDTAHPQFFSQKERTKYYYAVWKSLDKKFDIIDIKKKIKGLRTQYNCEKRSSYIAKKAGKEWENKFWAYEYLKFWEPAYKSIETYHEQHIDNSEEESMQQPREEVEEYDEQEEENGVIDEELDEDENENKLMLLDDSQDSSTERPKWAKNDVIKLIVAYKKYPELWDSTAYCTNKNKRIKYYQAIWKALDKKFDIIDIKKKIKGLRTQYACENRLRQLAEKTGKNVKKAFWAYELLQFLESKTINLEYRTDNNYNVENMNTEEEEEEEEEEEIESKEFNFVNINQVELDGQEEETVDFNINLPLSVDDDIEVMNISVEKGKRKWSQNEIITLIDAYKNLNGLWDPKHADFSNQGERLKYYQALWKALDKKYDIIDIKKKIRCLRTQYTYERRAKQIAKETGKQMNKPFWAYELLNFWEPTCIPLKERDGSPLEVEYVVEEDNNNNNIEEDEPLISVKINKQTKNPIFDNDSPNHSMSRGSKNDAGIKDKEQRFSWLGKKLVDTLNTLHDEYVICNAVNKVEEVIEAAQNGDFSTLPADNLLNLQMHNNADMQANKFCVSLVFDVQESNFSELMMAIAQLPALIDIRLSGKTLQNAVLR